MPAQTRQQQGRSRCIANTHFTQHQRIARQGLDQCTPIFHGLPALLGRHGRALRAVCRAWRHLASTQLRAWREVVRNAAVGHRQGNAVLSGQHADRCTACQKVLDHLPGHILRISRHALPRQTMIARAHQHLGLLQYGLRGLQNQADLHGDLLQPPQRA